MLCLQYYAFLRSLLFIVYGGGFVVKYLLVAKFQFALIWQKQVDTEEEEEKEDSPATKDTVSSDFINREIKSHVYSKQQTSDSSWEFLRIKNKQIKTVQNNSYV